MLNPLTIILQKKRVEAEGILNVLEQLQRTLLFTQNKELLEQTMDAYRLYLIRPTPLDFIKR